MGKAKQPILSEVESMIKSNALMAIDQRHDYDTLEQALDAYFDNVRDSLIEMKEQKSFDISFPMYRAYAFVEMVRLGLTVPESYSVKF